MPNHKEHELIRLTLSRRGLDFYALLIPETLVLFLVFDRLLQRFS